MAISKVELNEKLNAFSRVRDDYTKAVLNGDGDEKKADKALTELKDILKVLSGCNAKSDRLKRALKWYKDHDITLD